MRSIAPSLVRLGLALGVLLALTAARSPAPTTAQKVQSSPIVSVNQRSSAVSDGSVPNAPVGFAASSHYQLVKNWDFAHAIRDLPALHAEFFTRYAYEGGTLDHLNDEWSRYRDNKNHVFEDGGGLSLVARSTGPLQPGRIESGMLRSRWTGRYGVFEIRMKVPKGRGLWPAFWINPEDQHWPPEIDVVEIVDNGEAATQKSFHFLHGAGATQRRAPTVSLLDKEGAYAAPADYSQAYHVFSVEWTSTRVRHLVDGVPVADREFRWIHDDGKDAGMAHVLVNLAVGGNWTGPPRDAGEFPSKLAIDYIRVWQK